MVNPFQYGGVVAAGAFCNRTRELADLTRAAENAERLFVYAERRMGKTSLVQQMLDHLDRRKYIPVYVDLWPTDGPEGFVAALAKALTEGAESRTEKLLESAREFFGRLQPRVELDQSGNASLQFGVRPDDGRMPALQEVLAAAPAIAAKRQKRVVVVLDEFQQVLEYEDDSVERAVRATIQKQQGVAYFFLGSRKHLIEQMFVDRRRPLFRSAGHYPLDVIAPEHWVPFISSRFSEAGKSIIESQIVSMCGLTDGHPFYTQHLAHALWELTPHGGAVDDGAIDSALDLLLRRESYAFTTRWETLTRNQQRFLRGLAGSPQETRPFSSEFVRAHGLKTPSAAQRAAEGLLRLDIIDRSDGSYVISDRFLRLWIRRNAMPNQTPS